MRDFYATVAQVLPVVLLALVWESKYFDGLAQRPRTTRFWTLRRVRLYSLAVASVIFADLAACVLVLAGAFPDSPWLRSLIATGALLALASLFFRIIVHVMDSTR